MKIVFPDRIDLDEESLAAFHELGVQLLKKEAIFVNVARGAIVDEKALLRLLRQGLIRAAGLDVFQDEAFTGSVSSSIQEIAKLPNVVATPHSAYNTKETTVRLGQELLQDIQSCIAGSPINVTN